MKNGENNRDGHGDSRSDNYGVEGESRKPTSDCDSWKTSAIS